jgi:hypothetical protein
MDPDTGDGPGATAWHSVVIAWTLLAAFAASGSLAISNGSDLLLVFAALVGGVAAVWGLAMVSRASSAVGEREQHTDEAGPQPDEPAPASPFGPTCQIAWSAASEYFYAFAIDHDGVGHRFAWSPQVRGEGAGPPCEDSAAARTALRWLLKDLRDRGWRSLQADGDAVNERWYAHRFRFVGNGGGGERSRARPEAGGLTIPASWPSLPRPPAAPFTFPGAPASRATATWTAWRLAPAQVVRTLAGLACVAAPVGVALHAPAAVRVPAVLVLFTLTPGTILLWPGRSHQPVIDLGLVVGTSLATATLGTELMLWLGRWHPSLFLYALAGACAVALAARIAGEGRLG